MAPTQIILLACGSFNPPTNMHLRMFELARDNLNQLGQYLVIGGIVSPVHDAYGKKELIAGNYRCEMLRLALKSSDWIQISDWECTQETWSTTRRVLQYHQNLLNAVLNNRRDSPNNNQRNDFDNGYDYCSWITNDIRNTDGPVQIKLLCGADLLESFATPNLWAQEDIETIIGHFGIVVITRQGSDPRRFIYESDILTKHQHNITIVTEWITNDVSSTKVRRALRRHESVKYLLEDSVIDFIKKNELYGTSKSNAKYYSNTNHQLTIPKNTYILTPSPSDINMMSVSSSGTDIHLALTSILNQDDALTDIRPDRDTTRHFVEDLLATKLKAQVQSKEGHEYTGQTVSDTCGREQTETTVSPDQKVQVGYSECDLVRTGGDDDPRPDEPQPADVQETAKDQGRPSKKYSKEGKKMVKSDSHKNRQEIQMAKANLLLRKSKSDAIMSKKSQYGDDTTSVKIQFTKDGIQVISDKESIV